MQQAIVGQGCPERKRSGLIVQRPMATLRGEQGLVYLPATTRLREVKKCTHGHIGREASAGLFSPPCPLRAPLWSSVPRRPRDN